MSMESLEKKLKQLTGALNDVRASIKMPKMNIPKPKEPSNKLPGNPSKSKKDPVKVAEQIKNGDLKPQIMDQAKEVKESLKVSKSGQWSLQSK